jgi:hypothetical protein
VKDKDRSGKWLIEHHGGAILRLGGVTDLVRWQAAAADLVLPAKLPDGLIFAWRAGSERPEPYVVEIATYPETRTAEQALHDLLLILGRKTAMLESPFELVRSLLTREIVGKERHKDIRDPAPVIPVLSCRNLRSEPLDEEKGDRRA